MHRAPITLPFAFDSTMLESFAFATDDVAATASAGKKSEWPDFPGEVPKKHELEKWIEAWMDQIQQIGFGPLLRGEDPYELNNSE